VLEKYKGRVILVTKVRKGDHNTERNLRSRTVNRSHTVFHRSYVLAKEHQQKGAVIIGVTADDGGHREITTSYGDRVRTVFVDGKEAATLNCEALSHLELWGEVYSGTWIDDVELFYEGNAETLKKEHAEAMRHDLIRRQAEWKHEAEAWEAQIGK